MALVKAPNTYNNPSQIWPEKYSSCFWDAGAQGWMCYTVNAAPSPTPSAPPNGGSIPPSPISSPPNLQLTSGKMGVSNCGCCGGASQAATSPSGVSMSLASTTGAMATTAGKPCCGKCAGGSNWLAVLSALVLVVLAVAALSEK